MKYKISVVIPTHNIEKYLENTINSLLTQTIGFENLEVIIIDDNSTDGTKKIIEKFVSKYRNFKGIYLTENSGFPGKPRNMGLEKASGEYVMFMDHDDFYSEDFCEILYSKITEEKADIVFSRYSYVFDDKASSKSPNIFGEIDEIKINAIDDNQTFLKLAPSIWTKIFRKSFLIKNNIWFPEGMLGEDLSFITHSLLKANGIVYLNNCFGYNYRIRNSETEKSTIHIRNKKYLNSMILGYCDTYNILKKEKKEFYFPIIFEGHLEYWMNSFTFSKTSKLEKKDLLRKIAFLIKKQEKYGFDADKGYLALFDEIKNDEYDNAILISELIYFFKNRENILNKKYINSRKTNHKMNKLLEARKKQVAKLQTLNGWLNYKIKNISSRIKKKIKY